MSEAPERIWRVAPWMPHQYHHGLTSWTKPEEAGPNATEYVRADIHDISQTERHADGEHIGHLRTVLEEIGSYPCTCHSAYVDRGRSDPACMAGEVGDMAREAIGLEPVCRGRAAVRAALTAPEQQ